MKIQIHPLARYPEEIPHKIQYIETKYIESLCSKDSARRWILRMVSGEEIHISTEEFLKFELLLRQ